MGVATASGLLRRPTLSNPIRSIRRRFTRQCDKQTEKMTTPTRLYRRVVRVLPCHEKPETGARHPASKLQVEGLRLVVAEKGMRTNVKNAHGLLRGFVPSHLEAVAESVRSHANRVKKRPTTYARPLGNELGSCVSLHKTSSNTLRRHEIANRHWKGRNERRRSAFKRSEAISVP